MVLSKLAQQVPAGDEGFEAGHLDGGINAAAPEDASVVERLGLG